MKKIVKYKWLIIGGVLCILNFLYFYFLVQNNWFTFGGLEIALALTTLKMHIETEKNRRIRKEIEESIENFYKEMK